jgi:hypothetical protein
MQFPNFKPLTQQELAIAEVLAEDHPFRIAGVEYNRAITEYSRLKFSMRKKLNTPGAQEKLREVIGRIEKQREIISNHYKEVVPYIKAKERERLDQLNAKDIKELVGDFKQLQIKAIELFEAYLKAETEIDRLGCILHIEFIQSQFAPMKDHICSFDGITTDMKEAYQRLLALLSQILELAGKDSNLLNRKNYTPLDLEKIFNYYADSSNGKKRLEVEKIKLRKWEALSRDLQTTPPAAKATLAKSNTKKAQKKGKNNQSLKKTGGGGAAFEKPKDHEKDVEGGASASAHSGIDAISLEKQMRKAVENGIAMINSKNQEWVKRAAGGGGGGGGGADETSEHYKERERVRKSAESSVSTLEDLERGPISQKRLHHLFFDRKSFNIKELSRVYRWDDPSINADKIRRFDHTYNKLTEGETDAQQIKHFGPSIYKLLSDNEFRSQFVYQDARGSLMINCTMTLKNGQVMEGMLLFGLNEEGDAVKHRAFIRRDRGEKIVDFIKKGGKELLEAPESEGDTLEEGFTFVGTIAVELQGRNIVARYPNHPIVSELKIWNLT